MLSHAALILIVRDAEAIEEDDEAAAREVLIALFGFPAEANVTVGAVGQVSVLDLVEDFGGELVQILEFLDLSLQLLDLEILGVLLASDPHCGREGATDRAASEVDHESVPGLTVVQEPGANAMTTELSVNVFGEA